MPLAFGSSGTFHTFVLLKNACASVTWYFERISRCTLNRSSGSAGAPSAPALISERGLMMPGKAFCQVCSIGSLSSQAYRVTVPS